MCGEGSALKEFFNGWVPQLSAAVRRDADFDDPTIDLMAVCRPDSPKRDHVTKKRDPSLDELELIVGEIKKKNYYSEKLVDIMLKGLEKTLTSDLFRLFVEGRLPDNWWPIVRMNNDNTPYVEFLIKSEIADQDLISQLTGYSTEHMAYCKFILDHLYSCARHGRKSKSQIQNPRTSQTTPQKQLKAAHSHCKENRHSLPTPMSCSTPLAHRKVSVKRGSSHLKTSKDDLNDSKRILPSRACKSIPSGIYRSL